MEVQPLKWDVTSCVRDSVIFVPHLVVLDKHMMIHKNLGVTRGHSLASKVRYSKKDFVLEGLYAPWKRKLHMEGRHAWLQHPFVLSVPVERAFGPVLVIVKHVGHSVWILAVHPPTNHVIDLIDT
jgi:hypothetical protein